MRCEGCDVPTQLNELSIEFICNSCALRRKEMRLKFKSQKEIDQDEELKNIADRLNEKSKNINGKVEKLEEWLTHREWEDLPKPRYEEN